MRTTSQPILYFENAAGCLLEDPAGFLRANWSGNLRKPEDAQALFTRMHIALQQRGWSRILINQVGMQPFTPAEQEWVAKEWLPHAVREAGYRYGAVVVSPNVMVRLATSYITTHVQGMPLVYRSFELENQALAWLLRQPASPQW